MERLGFPNVTDKKTPRICIVGAGVAGLCAAIRLKKKLGIVDLTIFENQAEVGGIWNANTYPGCGCDVPMALYGYSFEPKPDCKTVFPSQEVILAYLKDTAKKHEIYTHIKFKTEVRGQYWEESLKKWRVLYLESGEKELREELFDIVINALGQFRVPNIPEAFDDFCGPLMHSSQWNHQISLENKIVGIVGNGSTAVQIIPAVASKVKELHVFQRNPSWIIYRPNSIPIFSWCRAIWSYFPFILWFLRIILFFLFDFVGYYLVMEWTVTRNMGAKLLGAYRWLATNRDIYPKLSPKVPLGCARPVYTGRYYKTLSLPNVKLHDSKIKLVQDDWILTEDGAKQRLDVLILATGYHLNDFDPMEIIGRDLKNIPQEWRTKGPSAYYTVVTHHAPNMFFLGGPNSHVDHHAFTFMAEFQVEFMIKILTEMMNRKTAYVTVTKSAEEEFMKKFEKTMAVHVLRRNECATKEKSSKNPRTLWSNNLTNYWWKTRKINHSHFTFDGLDENVCSIKI